MNSLFRSFVLCLSRALTLRRAVQLENWTVIRGRSGFKSELRDFTLKRAFSRRLCGKYDQFMRVMIQSMPEDDLAYLFEDRRFPSKRFFALADCFLQNVKQPYGGKNILFVGSGVAADVYFAKRLGFDTINTDIKTGNRLVDEVIEASLHYFGLMFQEFHLHAEADIVGQLQFKNGNKADYVYLRGVPFNRMKGARIGNSAGWWGEAEWFAFLRQLVKALNPGGCFICLGTYFVNEALTERIKISFNGSLKVENTHYQLPDHRMSDLKITLI